MATQQYDYVIVGGGLSGCVLAARLHEAHPSLSIALLEAGPDDSHNPAVLAHYNYESTPQSTISGRKIPNARGRILSGSSAVNYGAWTRGHAADFDNWAKQVGDSRWSYKGLLPYFRKSETWFDKDGDSNVHGFSGPIHLSSGGRGYPLREPLKEALMSTGAKFNPDMNSGDPNGVAQLVENWHNVSRQHAAICYDLKGVSVITDTVVQRVVFEGDRAVGVELTDGSKLSSTKEVILCAGAIRTPQVLMLSGIGPSSELSKFNIKQTADLPVGQNLHDHGSLNIVWKLKRPEDGLAFGSPGFNKPEYMTGNPMDWFLSAVAPEDQLEKASKIDGDKFERGPRTDYEVTIMYAITAAAPVEMAKMDGTHITTGILCLSPTSRGTITLSSDKATGSPLIDPNYFATEHDRVVIRSGIRECLTIMESDPLKDIIEGETAPAGMPTLNSKSSDKEIDERLNAMSWSWFHTAGTAAMGKVVDTDCKVKGVRGLRVVDASILPLSITAHLQAPMYAVAEAAADIIAQDV